MFVQKENNQLLDHLLCEPTDKHCIVRLIFPTSRSAPIVLYANYHCHESYDIESGKCQHFYLTRCGQRFNPPLPSNVDLCTPFWDGQSILDTFPEIECWRYSTCAAQHSAILQRVCLDNTYYSIPDNECKPLDKVDCGIRSIQN